jgi:hypothetical protein
MFGTNSFKTLMAAGALALTAGAASAATITSCPDSPSTTDREFVLETQDPIGNTCFATGSPTDANDSEFQDLLADLDPAATFLGKIEYVESGESLILEQTGPEGSLLSDMIALLGGTSGSFTIDLTNIVNAILVFKVGQTPGPAFAAFAVESGMVTGFWSTTPITGGGLSHVALYGSVAPIPLPAAGFLLIGALGGLAALRRRRRAV